MHAFCGKPVASSSSCRAAARGDTMHKKNAGVCIAAQTLFDCVDREEIKERIFNYLIYTRADYYYFNASAAGHFPTVDQ
jgi:hypothetical protein